MAGRFLSGRVLQFNFVDHGSSEDYVTLILFVHGSIHFAAGLTCSRIGLDAIDDVTEELAEAAGDRLALRRITHV